jgi:DNA modification methylase
MVNQSNNTNRQTIFSSLETPSLFNGIVILNKEKFIEILNSVIKLKELELIKNKILSLKNIISNYRKDDEGILNIEANGDTITVRRDVLISELDQILESLTNQRAIYYTKRLLNGIQKVKTNKINDINLLRWKEYDEIITDSLWILGKRDSSGAHLGWYWGNFVPQIPHQLMLRYTKKGDWVFDAFAGSGTTLIECRRLGRNGVGVELNSDVAEKASLLIKKETNNFNVISEILIDDSRTIDLKSILKRFNLNYYQLLIMHPPYHDIIKFSKNENDLSNAKNVEEFLKMFGEVVDNFYPFLEKGRYFALVIGDKYSKGEWIPLGFYCMQEVLKRPFQLKSIIVKNFEETRGKRNQQELWRYRALVGGFYVFKHEYIMLFKKK